MTGVQTCALPILKLTLKMKARVWTMNIANKLTVFRLLLIPIIVVIMSIYKTDNLLPAVIFILAAITDTLDGKLARKYDMVTDFGKFMDSLADKMMTCAVLVMLMDLQKIPAWSVIIIIMREFGIMGFRVIAASKGKVIAASFFGKLKTTFQFLAVILFLLNNKIIYEFPIRIDMIVFYVAVFFTVLSFIDYFIKNINVLDLKNI